MSVNKWIKWSFGLAAFVSFIRSGIAADHERYMEAIYFLLVLWFILWLFSRDEEVAHRRDMKDLH